MQRSTQTIWLLIVSSSLWWNQTAVAQPLQPDFAPTGQPRELTPQEKKADREKLYTSLVLGPLKEFCFSCHSDQKALAGLNLQRLKPDFETPASVEMWQRVYERIRDGEMPPKGAKAPAVKPVVRDPALPLSPFPMREEFAERARENKRAEFGGLELLLGRADLLYPNVLKTSEPLVIRAEDSPLLRLQKQLRNSTLQRAQEVLEMHDSGRVELAAIADSFRAFTDADVPLATTKEQRITSLSNLVSAYRLLERSAYARHQGGAADREQFLIAKNTRLEAQIRLQAEIDKK